MLFDMNVLSEKLRRMACTMIVAGNTPEQVLGVMDIFEKLLQDDSNFADPEKWGQIIDGKEVMPFSFSKEGLRKIQSYRSYEPFEHVYKAGTAGIKNEHYSLLYFLTQYLVTLASLSDIIDLLPLKNEQKALESLKKKYKSIKYRVNPKEIYKRIPINRGFNKKEYQQAKKTVQDVIDSVERDYSSIKGLTEPEKEIVLKH